MKFKPLYFYSTVGVIAIIILIFLSQQDETELSQPEEVQTNQNIPDDEVHNPLKSGTNPNKNNVSESFKHKLDVLRKAIEENPEDTLKIREYADLLAAAHMKDQAIGYYKKILVVDPNRTDILFSLSFIYYSVGDLNNAELETKKIIAIEPENKNARYNLGAIAASKGEKERAMEIWKKLAEQYPNDEIGLKAKNSIEKL
jgi:tetratricopeptide (TPR) repeat protein